MTELAPYANLEEVNANETPTENIDTSVEAAREAISTNGPEITVPGLPKAALDLGEAAVSQLLETHVPHELTDKYSYKDNF